MMGTDQQREQWHILLRSWGVVSDHADQKFDEIATAYTGPGRFYHTLDHVLAVLSTVESLAPHAKNLNSVKLAAWLHDVIYDSKASDNEDRSADFAERLCQELSIPEGREVAALIRKTKTHDAGDDSDAQVLLDADLAILGASEADYLAYAEKELHDAFAKGWAVESIQPIRFGIRPDFKDMAFSEGGPKAWFAVVRRE